MLVLREHTVAIVLVHSMVVSLDEGSIIVLSAERGSASYCFCLLGLIVLPGVEGHSDKS